MTPVTVFRTLRIPLAPALALAVVALAGFTGACKSNDGEQAPTGQSVSVPSVIAAAAAAIVRPEGERGTDGNARGSERSFPGAVLIVEAGPDGEKQERYLSADAATAAGYTIIDLSDAWTPFLFEELLDGSGRPMPNRYRRVFIGLANDELDGDGQRLEPGAKNYLELYGIFPSLSVIRERFLLDETRTCVVPEDQAAMGAQKVIGHTVPPVAKRNAARMKKTFAELEKARLGG